MDAAYQWFAGANPVNATWPLVPTLLPDEIISSWLVRCALAQGCDPLTLTGSLWPGVRFWCTDPDKGLSKSQATDLGVFAGMPVEVLNSSTLASIRSALSEQGDFPNAITPWILCLGLRNRRRSGGLQYCPQCFVERQPYYEIQSRLAWQSICPIHQLTLLDRCQCCGSPLCPHLLTPPEEDLGRCHRCRFELKSAMGRTISSDAMCLQYAADRLLAGETQFYGDERLGVPDWFYLCRWMLGILRSAARARSSSSKQFFQRLNVDFEALTRPSTGLPFQYLTPMDRAHLLADTWKMIQAGPESLAQACSEFSIAPSLMPLPAGNPPAWVMSIIVGLQGRRSKGDIHHHADAPRSGKSVLMQWHRLLRKTKR